MGSAPISLGGSATSELATHVAGTVAPPPFSETFGGAVGGGLATAGVRAGIGLLQGEKPAKAAREGAYAGAGALIGGAIGTVVPVIGTTAGTFIGSTLASIFCFAAGTPITMADGSTRNVEDLDIGDDTFLGGPVLGVGRVLAPEIHRYRGRMVSGGHAVFEGQTWTRVEKSPLAVREDLPEPILVYPVVTANHLLVCDGWVSADFAEFDGAQMVTEPERLIALNADHERNRWIVEAMGFPQAGGDGVTTAAVAEHHIDTIQSWWMAHDWGRVPVDVLPETGVVVLVGDVPTAAGFLYFAETGAIAFAGYPVANPDARPRQQVLALRALAAGLAESARQRIGAGGILYAVTRVTPIQRAYLEAGWRVGEAGAMSLVYPFGDINLSCVTEN